jgi:hypothetical protein
MSRTVLGLFLATALSGQTFLELEGRYWSSTVDSRIRVERQGFGTEIDGSKDLGFDRSGFPEGRATLGLGRHRFSFDFTPIDISGDRVVSRTLFFNGRSYTIGTRILSELEVKHLQLGWSYLFHLSNRIKLGPLVEGHGFLLSGSLRAPEVNLASQEDLSVGIPTVGASLEISPHARVDIYGQATGMSVGDYGHFIGSEVGARFRPLRFFYVTGGYKTLNLRVVDSNDFARLYLRGPFVGGGFRW